MTALFTFIYFDSLSMNGCNKNDITIPVTIGKIALYKESRDSDICNCLHKSTITSKNRTIGRRLLQKSDTIFSLFFIKKKPVRV